MRGSRAGILLAVLISASLLLASAAQAAPSLSVEMNRLTKLGDPLTQVAENDEFVRYDVVVENTSAEVTSGALSVALELPAGLRLAAASGSEWSCTLSTATCTSSKAMVGGASYPTLSFSQIWIEGSAPKVVEVKVTASGAGASAPASAADSFARGPATPFGLELTGAKAEREDGSDEVQAGAHPYAAWAQFKMRLRTRPDGVSIPVEDIHGGVGEIPAGVVGNPAAAEAFCAYADLLVRDCPEEAAVGGVFLDLAPPEVPEAAELPEAVYRMVPEAGYPASFGFVTPITSFIVRTKVRSDGDYGITAMIPLVPASPQLFESIFTFCSYGPKLKSGFEGCKKRSDPGRNPVPFISLGTNCSLGQPMTRFGVDSWIHRGRYQPSGLPDLSDPNWTTRDFFSPELTGCEQLTDEWTSNHEPSFTFQPDQREADAPAAYTAHVHVPQDGLTDPDGLATSHLKDTIVTLPEGIGFNPGVGDGLAACSEEQIGLIGTNFPAPNRIRFDDQMPECPPNSKVALATIRTPLLEQSLHGSVYLAAQGDNPFNSNYAIYLTVEEPGIGVVFKLAGKVMPDPRTGQITTVFKDNPQLPFDDLDLKFFGGGRAALANPVTCGTFTTHTQATPWSAADPENPLPHEIARPSDPIAIDSGPNGSKCVSDPAQRPFDIGLSAGSRDPIAGAKSPFSFRITRPDGSQELDRLEISPPPGFVASLKGIPYCSEAQIAVAAIRSGKAEQGKPSCPSASQVGTTNSGAGPGPTPFYAPGKLYLSGPYKGETLSVVAITPAVAGPFDLGNVIVRSALKIDPRTARITAVTDPIPQILEGVPLRIRDIRIELDRAQWTQNPTSCEAMAVDVTAHGANGAIATPQNRFQLGGCERLGFKPKLQIKLIGGTKRGDHPALLATLRTRPNDANIAKAAVTLPRSAFLDQAHIRTICTRVQFAADACPKGATYGFAEAETPLLDYPLRGEVILRSSDNKLPDLVGRLRGVANIEAVGRIDSKRGGIRNTFDIVPDAPFDVFTLRMQGGSKGLVINSKDLCATTNRATVRFTAHNGATYNYRPKVTATACEKGKTRKAHKGGRGAKR